MTPAEERRKSPRYAVGAPARLTAGGETLDARVHDICRDAALVEANRWLMLHTEVGLALQLPGRDATGKVQLAGRVIRIEPGDQGTHRMAILFAEPEPKEQIKLELFLSEREAG